MYMLWFHIPARLLMLCLPSHSTWRLVPKQDHLVCFLGGSLMLGAATSGAVSLPVTIPPRASELTPQAQRDWKTGVELIETCMQTHDTATGLSPEIAHFRIPGDKVVGSSVPSDWYIKGAKYVTVSFACVCDAVIW